MGEDAGADLLRDRRIAMHFAIDFEERRTFVEDGQRLAHLARTRRVGTAEIGMRQQRDLWFDAKMANRLGGPQRGLGDLDGRWIVDDIGVAQKIRALRQDNAGERRRPAYPLANAKYLQHILRIPPAFAHRTP